MLKEHIFDEGIYLQNLNKDLLIESSIHIQNIDSVVDALLDYKDNGKYLYLKDIYKREFKKKKREDSEFLICNYDAGIKFTGVAKFELYPTYLFAIDVEQRYGVLPGVSSNRECFNEVFEYITSQGLKIKLKKDYKLNTFIKSHYNFLDKKDLYNKYKSKEILLDKCLYKKKHVGFFLKKAGSLFFLPKSQSRVFYIKGIQESKYNLHVVLIYKYIKMLEYYIKNNLVISYVDLKLNDYKKFDLLYKIVLVHVKRLFIILGKKLALFNFYWSFIVVRLIALNKYFKYLIIASEKLNYNLLQEYNNIVLKKNLSISIYRLVDSFYYHIGNTDSIKEIFFISIALNFYKKLIKCKIRLLKKNIKNLLSKLYSFDKNVKLVDRFSGGLSLENRLAAIFVGFSERKHKFCVLSRKKYYNNFRDMYLNLNLKKSLNRSFIKNKFNFRSKFRSMFNNFKKVKALSSKTILVKNNSNKIKLVIFSKYYFRNNNVYKKNSIYIKNFVLKKRKYKIKFITSFIKLKRKLNLKKVNATIG